MAKKTAEKRETTAEQSLPDSELEVMRVLWRHPKATARQVWTELTGEGSKWTYATVNTLLQRLEKKGYATSDKSMMTYVYSAKVGKEKVVKRRVKAVVDKLFDGQSGQMVLHVLRTAKLSREDHQEIQSLLEQAKK